MPAEFLQQFPGGYEIAYAAIPVIKTLDEPLRTEVREAFARSMVVIWRVMIGIAGAGALTVPLLREIKMHVVTEEKYGLKESDQEKKDDGEKL